MPVVCKVAPGCRACVGGVGYTKILGDVREGTAVVAIQTIRDALLEPDELVVEAVAVEVCPATRLSARHGEHLGLDELEMLRVTGGRRRDPADSQAADRADRCRLDETASVDSHGENCFNGGWLRFARWLS